MILEQKRIEALYDTLMDVDISCANRDFCDRIEKCLKESNDEK